MFNNYFYLLRSVLELREDLKDLTIQEAFTQEKDTLYLRISTEEFPYRHLIISANQNEPFLLIKKDHRKAKKNVAQFFQDYFPAKITDLEIAAYERIIKLTLFSGILYFVVRGNFTNIYFYSGTGLISFKKTKAEESEVEDDLKQYQFIANDPIVDFNNLNDIENLKQDFKKHYRFVPKEFLIELEKRNIKSEIEIIKQNFSNMLEEVSANNISVYFDESLEKTVFEPITFYKDSDTEFNEYDNFSEAIQNYLRVKYSTERIKLLEKKISKELEKELTKLSKKLNKLKGRIEDGSKEEIYSQIGTILKSNFNSIIPGSDKIELLNYYTNENIEIALDKKLSPSKNADKYFDKSRDEKIDYRKSIELYNNYKNEFNELLIVKTQFENSQTLDELKNIASELKLEKKEKRSNKLEDQIKFKHYIIEGTYHVYVGKDSQSNDLLSIKFAKQNDYWMHARGLPGSHVVLRVENKKEVVPKNILKSCAQLAAFHSKAKTAGTAPVSYTFAKYVTKRKGMGPGKVMIQKEKVLLVKPGIPANCEFVED